MELVVGNQKVNLRNTPEADPQYKNWAGELKPGEFFKATGVVKGKLYNGVDYWYKDAYNRYATMSGFTAPGANLDWPLRLLGIPQLWEITTGKNVTVAVIDSGIDHNNPDLSTAVSGTRSYNVLDDAEEAWPDTFNHGTACAGIVASRGAGAMKGVAPGCNLMVIKLANHDADYSIASNIVKAIRFAMQADIISMSFGSGEKNPVVENAIRAAMAKGTICIASAGDYPRRPGILFPANYKGMISVSSINCSNPLAANVGDGLFVQGSIVSASLPDPGTEGVTVVAPGENIRAYDCTGATDTFSGTSMAAPYVAGVAALWLSVIRQKNLAVSNYHDAFRNFLISTADKNIAAYDEKVSGHGLIKPLSILSL